MSMSNAVMMQPLILPVVAQHAVDMEIKQQNYHTVLCHLKVLSCLLFGSFCLDLGKKIGKKAFPDYKFWSSSCSH